MSETPIVRAEFDFEREFGMHQNWWVRDARVAGMPITLFLYVKSHAVHFEVTPALAKRELGLTDYAWKTAKNTLRRYGFILEVRDRWPAGSRAPMMKNGEPLRDRRGNARYADLTGNLRVRIFTQNPKPGVDLGPEGGIVMLDEPYESWLAKQQQVLSTAAGTGAETQSFTAPRISQGGAPVDEIRHTPIKEEENQGWLVSSPSLSNQPTNQTTRANEIDAKLEALAPDCGLTLAAIQREVGKRADLSTIDVVKATQDTLLKASGRVQKPASYVASVIVRHPENWRIGGDGTVPFDPAGPTDAFAAEPHAAACARGEHWWGATGLPDIDRSHCVDCGQPRRDVDPIFDELEKELLSTGGGH